MKRHIAFRFSCERSLDELRATAGAVTGWEWIERDNDDWGPYASTLLSEPPLRARLRLFEPSEFLLDIEVVGPRWAVDAFERRIRERILPDLGASFILDAEPHERRSFLEDDEPPRQRDAVVTFADYLRAGTAHGREFEVAHLLADAVTPWHAEIFLAWCDGHESIDGPRGLTFCGPRPPRESSVGDEWFDVRELVTMVRLERAWFSLDQVRAWQFGAVVAARSDLGVLHRVDAVTAAEAMRYAHWFGKTLPNVADYDEAEELIFEPSFKGVSPPALPDTEWTRETRPGGQGVVRVGSPSLLGAEPSVARLLATAAAPRQVFFRTTIPIGD